jgi:hypothetical protein
MCQRHRPNEAFSGKGHARHLCKECSQLPKESRQTTRRLDDLESMLRQKNISPLNIGMAMEWAEGDNPEVTELALIVADVGRVCPRRKKRMIRIRNDHPALWKRLLAADLVDFDQMPKPWDWPEGEDASPGVPFVVETGGGVETGGTDAPALMTDEEIFGVPYDDDDEDVPF